MRKIIASILLLSAAVAAPASAANVVSAAPTAPSFYAGVQIGSATTILGGYQIGKMFAAELDYSKHSEFVTSMGVHGVALMPLALNGDVPLSLFGKVGIVRTTFTIPGFCIFDACTQDFTQSAIGLGLGGGAQYDFSKHFSARAGFDFGAYNIGGVYVSGIVKF